MRVELIEDNSREGLIKKINNKFQYFNEIISIQFYEENYSSHRIYGAYIVVKI